VPRVDRLIEHHEVDSARAEVTDNLDQVGGLRAMQASDRPDGVLAVPVSTTHASVRAVSGPMLRPFCPAALPVLAGGHDGLCSA